MTRHAWRSGAKLPGRPQRWIGPVAILAAFTVLILLISPLRQFPVQDDWDYAKTVWDLLQTGVFHRSEVAQATLFFPAVWGGLFARVFGYSFATLRVSTLVLASGVLLFFYELLAELGFDLPRRLLGTATLLVAPTFVFLASSFMTDVPFLFGYMGALACYVRAWRRDDRQFALLGSMLAAVAFLSRQIGLLIPLTFGLFILVQPRSWVQSQTRAHVRLRWLLAGCLLPILVAGGYFIYTQFLGGGNWADRARTLSGTLGFLLQPNALGVMGGRFVMTAATIGIYLLPMWAALLGGWSVAHAGWEASPVWKKALLAVVTLGFTAVVIKLGMRASLFPYLTDILTRRGLRPYLAYNAYDSGAHRPYLFSGQVAAALTGLAGFLGLTLTLLALGRLGTRPAPELMLVYLATAALALVSLSFFSYYERYLLPLLPGAIVLLLDVSRRVRLKRWGGVLGFAVVAMASVLLMRDYFAWNQVKWDAGRALLDRGVAVETIDGGMEWDGWYLYDRSATYIRDHGLDMVIAPWLDVLDPQYIFAFRPTPGYHVLQTLPFRTPLRPGGWDQIYLLGRDP